MEAVKLTAEIAKLAAEAYGIFKEKKREDRDQQKNDRIHALEAEIAHLKRQLGDIEK